MDKRVEIISTVARRRRWTIEERVVILGEASQPRASITAVADRHGISRNLIYLWRRQAREGSMPGVTVRDGAPSPFVAVQIADRAEKAPGDEPSVYRHRSGDAGLGSSRSRSRTVA